MKRQLLLATFLVFAAAALAFAAESPDKIDLHDSWGVHNSTRDHVVFDHVLHQANNQCEDCHDSPEGGSKLKPEKEIKGMTDKNPAHTLCWDCHTKKRISGMKNCIKCHK